MDSDSVVNVLLGMGMPAAIALLNQAAWNPKLKGFVALVVCALAAVVVEWVRGEVTWSDYGATAVTITGAALVMYRVWWRPTLIAPTLEAATSVGVREQA